MATDWVEMVHDVTGGKGRVPNKESVVAARRAKGWRLATEKPASEKPPAVRKSRKQEPVVTDGGDDMNEEQDRG